MMRRVAALLGTAAAVLTTSCPFPAFAEEPQDCQVGTTSWVAGPPAALGVLGMERAWQLTRGAVTVAVVDSGVAADNPHLGEAVLPGLDLTGEGDARVDVQGHGTAVAGQIAARAVDGSGLVGVAPEATILPVRVYTGDRNSDVPEPTPELTAQGIRWAAEQGAQVVVVPLAATVDSPELHEAVTHATGLGALVVAPAGNVERGRDRTGPRYPAAYPEVLSVTATSLDGVPSDAVVHGPHVEVAAPGAEVLTTFLEWGDCVLAGAQPASSFATGYVGGVAALVAAAHPGESPADWEYRILATALRTNRGARDDVLGWGLVAPHAALALINDGGMVGPQNPRFPVVEPSPAEVVTPPAVAPDPMPARMRVLGLVVAAGAVVSTGILLVARLVTGRRGSRRAEP
ncbi:MAG: S8 family serine peptidase [Arachnia propionica]|uniref:S8 family serine peptidase n=1 Tax=Arachnia propionica TaxID=1750 RepID=UPI002703B805|nr:S8 family serine peptidase [Arachnia propionica]